jgi:hypothetical protein
MTELTADLKKHQFDLLHIGIKRRSGRYPWGSGEDPQERSRMFKSYIDEMRQSGLSETQIASHIDAIVKRYDPHESFTTADLRAGIAISTDTIKTENVMRARQLSEKRMSNRAIAEQMGLGKGPSAESTVRGWLKESDQRKESILKNTADLLRSQVDGDKPFLDVGKGNHLWMGISSTRLLTAVAMLRDEGYELHQVKTPQLGAGPGKLTTAKVLCRPGTTWHDARLAVVDGRLKIIAAQSDDGGLSYRQPKEEPVSVSSRRIQVRYDEDGGTTMDGVIEVRRGVPELDLGSGRYAQVRVAVDGSHYLKGMAMYADDLPAGVDIRFNTNKSRTDPKVVANGKLGAMKEMNVTKDGSIDTTNPFGATVRPKMYVDKNGKEKTSPLNLVNEEGRWDGWSKSLSSQMLSKQSVALASKQLGLARKAKEEELSKIMNLTNPIVRKKLLQEYADSADAAAVHLKAAAFDRQSTHVILPMNSLRPNEIYAPNFDNGEKVVLVRHPHGGPFEIPELTVNNNNRVAKRILEGARDAVGIHHTVAEQLSGADFDGDTVLVIPNSSRAVKTKPPLERLKGFDPKTQYKIPEGDETTRRMTKKGTQTEMGKISNLITDMTIKGANDADIANAVRHSMVVIDAEKHGLDYKQSEQDHQIARLKTLYQGGPTKGAATIISRASSDIRIPQVKQPSGDKGIDPVTGEKILIPTGRTRERTITTVSKRTGVETTKTVIQDVTTKGTKMEFTKNARSLLSNRPEPMEEVYASHANSMKALANAARKASIEITAPSKSKAAEGVYHTEISSLNAKLKLALQNAPLERRAQVIGNALAKARIDANPGLDKDDIKKIKYQSLEEGRRITDAHKARISITDREWEAIQSHALAPTKLSEILQHSDMDRVKELATPKRRGSLSPGQLARARQMMSSGRSITEIARELGIPRSTLTDNIGDN